MNERGLGKRLQVARLAAGLTQQQLCAKANLSFSTLTKIERGAIKSPSIFTIQSIANALNVGLDELIGNDSGATKQYKKTKSGVSFIYFDVNGCLVYLYQKAFAKLALDTGARLETIESVFWHYNDQVCRGEMSLSDLNSKIAERLGVREVKWQNYYLDTVEPIKVMHELLIWASEQFKVGLMTNIMPGLLSSMKQTAKIPDIRYNAVVDSSEIGSIKPEEKIYRLAQQLAEVPASEILLIDDDRVNLMAAEKLGWHMLWFDDSHPEDSAKRIKTALEPSSDA